MIVDPVRCKISSTRSVSSSASASDSEEEGAFEEALDDVEPLK